MGMMNRDDQVGDYLFFNIGIILGWWHDDWEDYWADTRDDKIGLLRIGIDASGLPPQMAGHS